MRFFNYFFNTPTSELKVNLLGNNSINEIDNKEVTLEIKNEKNSIDLQCEKLQRIIDKLDINNFNTKRKTRFSLFSLGLTGITGYGISRIINIGRSKTIALNQLAYNFSHLIINNSTCAESNPEDIDDYCEGRSSPADFIANTVLNQVSFLTQNMTQACKNMVEEYCNIESQRFGLRFADAVLGLAGFVFLATSIQYLYLRSDRKTYPPCDGCDTEQFKSRNALSQDDINLLTSYGIHIDRNTLAEDTVNQIRDKMLELRVKTERYEPKVYNQIVMGYLNPETDGTAIAAVRSFFS